MCEFCHKHGEGKKWYLQAKNYAEDLLSDRRRRRLLADFLRHPEEIAKEVRHIGQLHKAPGFVRPMLAWFISNRAKKYHFGQVVPMEEISGIFDFVTSIVRVACFCRHATVGSEQRYCYLVSMAPNGGQFAQLIREIDVSYLTGPDTVGLESLSKEEALAAVREHEKEGLCHTVWTFIAPFIGGICNCDRSDCLAMRATVTYETPVMFRAEFVAEANLDSCTGCRACMRVCQFGAIGYSAAKEKAVIDLRSCYGCGICRSACSNDAITLHDRSALSVVSAIY